MEEKIRNVSEKIINAAVSYSISKDVQIEESNNKNLYFNYTDQHYSPIELMRLLSDICHDKVEILRKKLEDLEEDTSKNSCYIFSYKREKRNLENIISDCSLWIEDEVNIEKI